jgi:nucleolin
MAATSIDAVPIEDDHVSRKKRSKKRKLENGQSTQISKISRTVEEPNELEINEDDCTPLISQRNTEPTGTSSPKSNNKKKKKSKKENVSNNVEELNTESTSPKKKKNSKKEQNEMEEELNTESTSPLIPPSPLKKKKKSKKGNSLNEVEIAESIPLPPSSFPKKKSKKEKNSLNEAEEEEEITAESTSLVQIAVSPPSSPGVSKKKKSSKKVQDQSTRFARIGEDIEVDHRLQDNSFEAKRGARGSWGEKANKDLKFTKGKSFRHEKTKKKRGTYRGGAIDTSVNSIKFDSD